jgi:hypothetical protein
MVTNGVTRLVIAMNYSVTMYGYYVTNYVVNVKKMLLVMLLELQNMLPPLLYDTKICYYRCYYTYKSMLLTHLVTRKCMLLQLNL